MVTLLIEKGPISDKLVAMTSEQTAFYKRFEGDDVLKRTISSSLNLLRIKTFEGATTDLLHLFGCRGRNGNLTNGLLLKTLKDLSDSNATSIVNTYNFSLARKVLSMDVSNKRTAHKEIKIWRLKRFTWKAKQIDMWTKGSTRRLAAKEFIARNKHVLSYTGSVAKLFPRRAKEPICQGWINRGFIPIEEAVDSAPPYHLNCPHFFKYKIRKVRVPQRLKTCPLLWTGEN